MDQLKIITQNVKNIILIQNMAIIEQNGITFNNVYKDGGSKHGDTIIQGTYDSTKATPSDENFPLVNAVDIDWNGARPGID